MPDFTFNPIIDDLPNGAWLMTGQGAESFWFKRTRFSVRCVDNRMVITQTVEVNPDWQAEYARYQLAKAQNQANVARLQKFSDSLMKAA